MLALILGVLQVGSEYNWGTLKTTFMQQPGRAKVFLAKVSAIGGVLVLFTVGVLGTVALGSVVVALRENAAITWPPVSDILLAMGSGWLILAMWALFGILFSVLFQGTSMAIGLGILYGLIIEGLITNFGNSISILADASQAFLRTNAYSLVAPLGVQGETGGPGSFSNGFVDPWQALIVIVAYLVIFCGISALLLQRRDVA
jgi:ABC-type transport system involved in multi-copper enzyme maturation permease subunit